MKERTRNVNADYDIVGSYATADGHQGVVVATRDIQGCQVASLVQLDNGAIYSLEFSGECS